MGDNDQYHRDRHVVLVGKSLLSQVRLNGKQLNKDLKGKEQTTGKQHLGARLGIPCSLDTLSMAVGSLMRAMKWLDLENFFITESNSSAIL